MRIFIAGATGVLGIRVVPLLVAEGHEVWGMTRTPSKADTLRALGAEPSVCDVFDFPALRDAVLDAGPEILLHLLTDLPDDVSAIDGSTGANVRIRREGTRNLLRAARAAGTTRFIAESVAWQLPDDAGRAVTELERAVLHVGGVVLRYGQFYGPGTYHEQQPPRHRGSISTRRHDRPSAPSRHARACSRSSIRSTPTRTTERSRTPRRGPSGPWPTSGR